MTGLEMRYARKKMGLTQAGLAEGLGISRKHVVAMEADTAAIESRMVLALTGLADERGTVIFDSFKVESTTHSTFMVVRRMSRDVPHPRAMSWIVSESILYGEFRTPEHAARWALALRKSDNARNTRRLIRERKRELDLLTSRPKATG